MILQILQHRLVCLDFQQLCVAGPRHSLTDPGTHFVRDMDLLSYYEKEWNIEQKTIGQHRSQFYLHEKKVEMGSVEENIVAACGKLLHENGYSHIAFSNSAN